MYVELFQSCTGLLPKYEGRARLSIYYTLYIIIFHIRTCSKVKKIHFDIIMWIWQNSNHHFQFLAYVNEFLHKMDYRTDRTSFYHWSSPFFVNISLPLWATMRRSNGTNHILQLSRDEDPATAAATAAPPWSCRRWRRACWVAAAGTKGNANTILIGCCCCCCEEMGWRWWWGTRKRSSTEM